MSEEILRVKDKEYQEIRDQVLKRDRRECIDCSYSIGDELSKQPHVHHVLPERLFDWQNPHRVENLVTLCSMCHGAWEKEFRAMMEGRPAWDQNIRNRVRKHLHEDIESLKEHFPEVHEIVIEAVCKGGDPDE